MTAPAVDKELVRRRFRRSLPSYDANAGVQRQMACSLVAAVQSLGRTIFPRVLEIGSGTGLLTREIARRFPVRDYYANDINADCGPPLAQVLGPGCALTFLAGDIERLETLPVELDLVASNAVFHWLDEPGALLARLARGLARDGCLAFTTFGPANLREIGEITGRRLAYRSFREIQAMLKGHYRLRRSSERQVPLRFESPRSVLEHLRRTGVNSLGGGAWTRGGLRFFEQEYRRRFALPGGAVSLSYHPMLFVAEALTR